MRPRPGGRGEDEFKGLLDEMQELQCGHDPEAVESQPAERLVEFQGAVLQWATTRRPWRDVVRE